MTFRLVQISDTHLSEAKPCFVPNYERTATFIANRPADLIVHSGDISLDGVAQRDDLMAAAALLKTLPGTIKSIPGNHDIGESYRTGEHPEPPVTVGRLDAYHNAFGPDFWSLDVPGWRVLGINAQILGSGLPDEATQLDFVVRQFAGAGERAIALFIHKPLFDADPGEEIVGGRFVNPQPRQRLLAAFGERFPALIASGHVHQYRSTWWGATQCIWAPSTGFMIPDSKQPLYGQKIVGYVEHDLHPDGRHDSRLVCVPGAPILNIADVPEAYGPVS